MRYNVYSVCVSRVSCKRYGFFFFFAFTNFEHLAEFRGDFFRVLVVPTIIHRFNERMKEKNIWIMNTQCVRLFRSREAPRLNVSPLLLCERSKNTWILLVTSPSHRHRSVVAVVFVSNARLDVLENSTKANTHAHTHTGERTNERTNMRWFRYKQIIYFYRWNLKVNFDVDSCFVIYSNQSSELRIIRIGRMALGCSCRLPLSWRRLKIVRKLHASQLCCRRRPIFVGGLCDRL